MVISLTKIDNICYFIVSVLHNLYFPSYKLQPCILSEKKIKGVIQGFVQSKHLQIVQKQLITSGTPWDHSISIRKLYPETDYDMFFPFENFIAATKLFCPPFNIDRHSQRLVELSALHISEFFT